MRQGSKQYPASGLTGDAGRPGAVLSSVREGKGKN